MPSFQTIFGSEVFSSTLSSMGMLFLFIAIGYLLRKLKVLPKGTDTVLSRLETNLFLPAMILSTFTTRCSVENLIATKNLLYWSIGLLAVTCLIAYALAHAFAKEQFQRNVYFYSFVIPNLGFVGNALVKAVFGMDVLFEFMMFTMPMQVFIYTAGIILLTPRKGKLKLKDVFNPNICSLIIGAAIGLLNIKLPTIVSNTIESASACMAPIAMLLTGYVVAGYKLGNMLNKPRIYLASFIRLIALPAVLVLALRLLKADETVCRAALCFLAMPLGLNTVVFPAAYGGDTTTGASMAIISHALAVITIPVMLAIFL